MIKSEIGMIGLGVMGRSLALNMAGKGFKEVYNLKGGILSWKALGRPVEVD